MTYDRCDVVVVPFPFTDRKRAKRRPALVLSSWEHFGRTAGHSVMAMITSAANASWPFDVQIANLQAAGLPAPSLVRMKLFTLDHRLVLRKAGTLVPPDRQAVDRAVRAALGI